MKVFIGFAEFYSKPAKADKHYKINNLMPLT